MDEKVFWVDVKEFLVDVMVFWVDEKVFGEDVKDLKLKSILSWCESILSGC